MAELLYVAASRRQFLLELRLLFLDALELRIQRLGLRPRLLDGEGRRRGLTRPAAHDLSREKGNARRSERITGLKTPAATLLPRLPPHKLLSPLKMHI
jgi:hypothetical protein